MCGSPVVTGCPHVTTYTRTQGQTPSGSPSGQQSGPMIIHNQTQYNMQSCTYKKDQLLHCRRPYLNGCKPRRCPHHGRRVHANIRIHLQIILSHTVSSGNRLPFSPCDALLILFRSIFIVTDGLTITSRSCCSAMSLLLSRKPRGMGTTVASLVANCMMRRYQCM